MKYFVCIIGLLIKTQAANAQHNIAKFQLISDIYAEWKSSHINIPQTACDTFYYTANVFPTVLNQLRKIIRENKVIFRQAINKPTSETDSAKMEKIVITEAESDSLALQIDFIQRLAWPENMFHNSKLIAMDSVDILLNKIESHKDSLMKKLCYKIHIYSVPLVFRNNTLCLFYSAKADILSHFGRFYLYRKENNNWKEFAVIAHAWNR
jgi:hypothetical protein